MRRVEVCPPAELAAYLDALARPAVLPVETFPVRIEGDKVVVEVFATETPG